MKYLILLFFLLQTACSTLPTHKPISPKVEIDKVDIVKLGLLTQELAFTLNVFNPNNYDLPVNELQFTASSDQQDIASGSSKQPVVLAANTSTAVVVNVTARLDKVFRKLIAAVSNAEDVWEYVVTGFVKLDNWPTRISFDVERGFSLD